MQAPAFWWQVKTEPVARLLTPLASLYGWTAARRLRKAGARLPLPVICIGNFVAGGAGKTPLALTLGRHLVALGERPYFLSRGYRSAAENRGPVVVDPARHSAADVGDEPLLLARVAPTIVGADRVAGGHLAHCLGATLLILDDGLQNPAVEKDLCLVVVDGRTGIGNGLCLPAGPLRAPLAAQMGLASAVIVIGQGEAGGSVAALAAAAARPIIGADLVIPAAMAADLAGRKIYAFAGLGLPDKFYASLAAAGADIVGTMSFPDHHPYNWQEIHDLQRQARQYGALLATTEKDFVRLAHLAWPDADPTLPAPMAVPVTLEFADSSLLDEIVAAAIAAAQTRITSPTFRPMSRQA
jgi:tetraacyldisaccharide 4'-kinase